MDDLNQQISQILSDPQSMKQIQDMMGALGLGGAQANGPPAGTAQGPQGGGRQPSPPSAPAQPQSGGIDPSALMGALSALGGPSGQGGGNGGFPQGAGSPGVTPEMLQMVSRMAPLLSQVNREDDSTRLLRALRPLLGPARQQKLDEAIKILHMMRLLPLLKESGLFSGLLTGLL